MNVASIDIGTNTIILQIVEVTNKNVIKTLNTFYKVPRIGKYLREGEPFSLESIKRLTDVIDDYKKQIDFYNCKMVIASATHAFRIASNSQDVIDLIYKTYNIKINILSTNDEAELSYLGTIGANNRSRNLLIDIGGGSTELIYGISNILVYSNSFKYGAVNSSAVMDPYMNYEGYRSLTKEVFSEINTYEYKFEKIFAIAGTPTTLAAISLGLLEFDEKYIDNFQLTAETLDDLIFMMRDMGSHNLLLNFGGLVEGREDVLLAGSIILKVIMETLSIPSLSVSTSGLRYGAVIKYLNQL